MSTAAAVDFIAAVSDYAEIVVKSGVFFIDTDIPICVYGRYALT